MLRGVRAHRMLLVLAAAVAGDDQVTKDRILCANRLLTDSNELFPYEAAQTLGAQKTKSSRPGSSGGRSVRPRRAKRSFRFPSKSNTTPRPRRFVLL